MIDKYFTQAQQFVRENVAGIAPNHRGRITDRLATAKRRIVIETLQAWRKMISDTSKFAEPYKQDPESTQGVFYKFADTILESIRREMDRQIEELIARDNPPPHRPSER